MLAFVCMTKDFGNASRRNKNRLHHPIHREYVSLLKSLRRQRASLRETEAARRFVLQPDACGCSRQPGKARSAPGLAFYACATKRREFPAPLASLARKVSASAVVFAVAVQFASLLPSTFTAP